jgi:hypothetical protein
MFFATKDSNRLLSATDIDSTDGQIIWSFNGTDAPERGWRVHNTQIKGGMGFIG